MSGKAEEPYFTLFPGFKKSFNGATLAEYLFYICQLCDCMQLIKIKMIGSKIFKRLFKLFP